MRKCLSIDWLQLHVDCSNLNLKSALTMEKKPFSTKEFKTIYEIISAGELIAVLACEPNSNIMKKSTGLLKIQNRILYRTDLQAYINLIMEELQLSYNNITRIDICLDFNYFINSYYPEQFIRDFLNEKILKNGRGKFTVIGEQKHCNNYQYLRFGTKTSDVNVYLYDKTRELEQVQDKPYIKEKWKLAGLDLNKKIWRLEVSIKSKGTNYIRQDTGEIDRINIFNIFEKDYLNDIFFSYIAQYFAFKIKDKKKNKTRMEDLILFDRTTTNLKKMYLPNSTGSNVADKILIKKLYQFDQEFRGTTNESIQAAKILLDEMLNITNLNDYFNDKKDYWNKKHRREF